MDSIKKFIENHSRREWHGIKEILDVLENSVEKKVQGFFKEKKLEREYESVKKKTKDEHPQNDLQSRLLYISDLMNNCVDKISEQTMEDHDKVHDELQVFFASNGHVKK